MAPKIFHRAAMHRNVIPSHDFEPGFKFDKALEHPFWEELLLLEGHMIDFYALRPPGVVHGPFGTELGCTLLETAWYDKDWYLRKYAKS
jgi:hypothetical protein